MHKSFYGKVNMECWTRKDTLGFIYLLIAKGRMIHSWMNKLVYLIPYSDRYVCYVYDCLDLYAHHTLSFSTVITTVKRQAAMNTARM